MSCIFFRVVDLTRWIVVLMDHRGGEYGQGVIKSNQIKFQTLYVLVGSPVGATVVKFD